MREKLTGHPWTKNRLTDLKHRLSKFNFFLLLRDKFSVVFISAKGLSEKWTNTYWFISLSSSWLIDFF